MDIVYNFVYHILNSYILANVDTVSADVLHFYVVGITLLIDTLIIYLPTLAIYKFIKMFDRGLI